MSSSLKNSNFTLQIETTNACNYNCLMCARTENPPSKRSLLSLSSFKKLLRQLKNMRINIFAGHNLGEPLLTPRYIEMLECFDKTFKNKLFVFNTNGSLLTEKFTKRFLKLKNNRFQINFSIDAATKPTYKKVHGHSILPARKNILDFLDKLNKNRTKNITVILNFTNQRPV